MSKDISSSGEVAVGEKESADSMMSKDKKKRVKISVGEKDNVEKSVYYKVNEKFYPTAFSLSYNVFPGLRPHELVKCFGDLVRQFDKDPHTYFTSNKKKFDGRYLFKISKEVKSFLSFLETATIDESGKIAVPRRSSMYGSWGRRAQAGNLFSSWWKQSDKKSYLRFYGLCADYFSSLFVAQSMMFGKGIEIPRDKLDYSLADYTMTSRQIESVIGKIKGLDSKYDVRYCRLLLSQVHRIVRQLDRKKMEKNKNNRPGGMR